MRTSTIHHLANESARVDNDAKSLPTLAEPGWQEWQGELFPLEPWGAPTEFALVDCPQPCIARALVGPLHLGFGVGEL